MRYDTYTLVSLSVEICLWLFHLSVFVAIATQVARRVYPFNSAFYKLYVLQSVFDFLNFLNVCALEGCPTFPSHFKYFHRRVFVCLSLAYIIRTAYV